MAAAIVLGVWLTVQTWGYASKLELALGLALLVSAAFGGYLLAIVKGFDILHRRRAR